MPKRTDIDSILVIGAGPIVIGQACEFDYSGAQACKALREEGYRVILVNSNPATIMTDPQMAQATYIEPIEWRTVERIIEREKPTALLPTMGGQTALNCALDLHREGVLERHGVQMIGASLEAIATAEDRELFREAMAEIGLVQARARVVRTVDEAIAFAPESGYPVILRPSYTLGGTGGGIARDEAELRRMTEYGLSASPVGEVLLEESLLGWKEFEMEVVRDANDNCIIVCSIENLDPMGVHTGDSITVAPAQTLTDKEYQRMRDASLAVLRKIGVDTGGSNVQFAVDPETGRMVIIEMNPRVSRSSALASKATGFPIAKVAARLAVGYTLDELRNEITDGATPCSFEPTLDYIVTKLPRFTFEKFPQAEPMLTTQMKSVGEAMAMGRTFCESLQKALRSLETGRSGLDPLGPRGREERTRQLREPGPHRLWHLADALREGWSEEEVCVASCVDPWFVAEIAALVRAEASIAATSWDALDAGTLRDWKRDGFSDRRLADLLGREEEEVRALRTDLDIHPVYKRVDTCAAEFPTSTAYLYSSYEEECEARPTNRRKVVVLGGGPNRIGQGIEFDYCCVHAVQAAIEQGFETIMINCNPETVSTDYDTADRLYFEPLVLEDVLEVLRIEKPHGVILQFGGQTPLKLARGLEAVGIPILGTSPDAIDAAEDRERFTSVLEDLGLRQPPGGTARTGEEAVRLGRTTGYPLVVRPSYVLGGRAMEVVFGEDELRQYIDEAVHVSERTPVLLDRFLEDAVEVDVDIVCDGEDVLVGGVMQHIEQAGVHSGDSACSLPPYSIPDAVTDELRAQSAALARALGVVGLMNMQFAVQGQEVYVIEANPRASRTVPFVSKTTGRSLARIATRCMLGTSLRAQGVLKEPALSYFSVKEAVFPFLKFPGVDPILGPEMKSTGEVMGVGVGFEEAFAKAQLAAGVVVPESGCALISVKDSDKERSVEVARILADSGFALRATHGTAAYLREAGIECDGVNKVAAGSPHVVDHIRAGNIQLIINTTQDKQAIRDSREIRSMALAHQVCYVTTMTGAAALVRVLGCGLTGEVYRLQQLHRERVDPPVAVDTE